MVGRRRARRNRARGWLALIAALALALARPTPAWSQPPDARQRAEAPLREGLELAKAGKNEEALAKFEAAYALSPSGAAVYRIARMEQLLGRHALALQHFREATRDPALAVDARRDSEQAITELRTRVGIITFDVPGGATTTLDGNEIDPSVAIEVVPGLHLVKVRLGGETRAVDVTAPAGAVTPVKVRFGEPTTAPPSAAVHPRPVERDPSPPSSGYWSNGRIAGVALVGAGVAGLAAGLGFQVAASSAGDDADNVRRSLPSGAPTACGDPANRARCNELESAIDDQNAANDLRTGFFVGGSALVVGGAALFLLSSPSSAGHASSQGRAGPIRLVPVATGKDAGLFLSGRF